MKRALGLLAILLLAGCAAPAAPNPYPSSMAALGDSISLGVNVARDKLGENPGNSWSVGDDATDGVTSHYERLVALNPALAGHAYDFARSGARMRDFARQAQEAADAKAEYATVMFGANDVCGAGNATSVDAFRAQFDAGAQILKDAGAKVLVVSVPNVTGLYERYHSVRAVHDAWQALRVCQNVLGDRVTPEARNATAARIDAYNAVLRDEAARFGFSWDRGAVHEGEIVEADVGPVDFFHPSLHGQASLAEATWRAGPFGSQ